MPSGELSVELHEKSSVDRQRWLREMWDSYRSDLLGAGYSPEEAEKNIARTREQIWTDDDLVEGHVLFDVVSQNATIGTLWLATRNETASEWWIYDIVVNEEFRGSGFGRPTLRAAEEYARAHGGQRLGLNVFGPNAVARHLYESSGYEIISQQMYKALN